MISLTKFLNIFNKYEHVYAPVSGTVISLKKIPDSLISSGFAGIGIAIDPIENIIVSPSSGYLTSVFKTNHAFVITTDSGVQILVHIGLDTVTLNGEGFESLINTGEKVTAGTPIIKFNKNFIKNKGLLLLTPILITNYNKIKNYKEHRNYTVKASKDILFSFTC